MERRKYLPRTNYDIRVENSEPMDTIVHESDFDCLIKCSYGCCTVLYYTVLYCTVLYCTVLYLTVMRGNVCKTVSSVLTLDYSSSNTQVVTRGELYETVWDCIGLYGIMEMYGTVWISMKLYGTLLSCRKLY